jgi:Domain of unknown function (DUF1918)
MPGIIDNTRAERSSAWIWDSRPRQMVESNVRGSERRRGEVIAVLGEDGTEHYQVR